MATKKRQPKKARDFQKEYANLLRAIVIPLPPPPQPSNLRQPSQFKVVESVTTYSAYEEAI